MREDISGDNVFKRHALHRGRDEVEGQSAADAMCSCSQSRHIKRKLKTFIVDGSKQLQIDLQTS